MAEKSTPNNTGAGKPQGFRQEYKLTGKEPAPAQTGAAGKDTVEKKY